MRDDCKRILSALFIELPFFRQIAYIILRRGRLIRDFFSFSRYLRLELCFLVIAAKPCSIISDCRTGITLFFGQDKSRQPRYYNQTYQ